MLSTGSIVLAGTHPAFSTRSLLGELAERGLVGGTDGDESCLAERIWHLTQAPQRVAEVCTQLSGGGVGALDAARAARVRGLLEALVERDLLELVPV